MNFLILPMVHLLAVMSPGPDFLLILKHSLLHSRLQSLISAFGIACGCLIHMGTVIMFIFFFEAEAAWVSQVLKVLGSGYLIFLGITSLKEFIIGFYPKSSSPESGEETFSDPIKENSSHQGDARGEKIQKVEFKTYFLKGFFCNLLNPKAWAYFFSVFAAITSELSSLEILIIVFLFYIITQGWFSLVTILFTLPSVNSRLKSYRRTMSLLSGIAFCVLGISLMIN